MTCKRCKGDKHYVDSSGIAVRCECVRERVREIAYAAADVPPVYRSGGLSDKPALSAKAVARLVARGSRDRGWLRCSLTGRYYGPTVAGVLRAAVDNRRTAGCLFLSKVLDSRFGDRADRDVVEDRLLRDVLVVVLDAQTGHKFIPQVMTDLWVSRAGRRAATLWVSSDDVASMPGRYGVEVAGLFRAGAGWTFKVSTFKERS